MSFRRSTFDQVINPPPQTIKDVSGLCKLFCDVEVKGHRLRSAYLQDTTRAATLKNSAGMSGHSVEHNPNEEEKRKRSVPSHEEYQKINK